MHLSQIPCFRLLALDTRFDSAFMCKECVTVSAQKFSLLRSESPMRLLHWCPRSESNRHAFKGGGF